VTTERPGEAAEVAGPWGVGELPYQIRRFLRMLFIAHRGPILKISRNKYIYSEFVTVFARVILTKHFIFLKYCL